MAERIGWVFVTNSGGSVKVAIRPPKPLSDCVRTTTAQNRIIAKE